MEVGAVHMPEHDNNGREDGHGMPGPPMGKESTGGRPTYKPDTIGAREGETGDSSPADGDRDGDSSTGGLGLACLRQAGLE